MDYKQMFYPELIELKVESSTIEEAFQIIASKLKDKGMVKDNYIKGIIEREQKFPTGLITRYMNIALPHADPEYIVKPFVFICRLNQAVTCYQMGDNQQMDVKDLFFLGITDGKEQVGLLQAFMHLFMDKTFVQSYQKANSTEMVYQLFTENI